MNALVDSFLKAELAVEVEGLRRAYGEHPSR
jgi:hypothetical protein